MALMRRGVENRKTGETKMNRESSRSHCVFSCSLEGNSKGTGGLTNTRFSRLNLIDLAGGSSAPQLMKNLYSTAQPQPFSASSCLHSSSLFHLYPSHSFHAGRFCTLKKLYKELQEFDHSCVLGEGCICSGNDPFSHPARTSHQTSLELTS